MDCASAMIRWRRLTIELTRRNHDSSTASKNVWASAFRKYFAASDSAVAFINAGQGDSLFWQIGSSATLGTNTAFAGNILALISITLDTSATIACGRALARNGAVTQDSNLVSIDTAGCGRAG